MRSAMRAQNQLHGTGAVKSGGPRGGRRHPPWTRRFHSPVSSGNGYTPRQGNHSVNALERRSSAEPDPHITKGKSANELPLLRMSK